MAPTLCPPAWACSNRLELAGQVAPKLEKVLKQVVYWGQAVEEDIAAASAGQVQVGNLPSPKWGQERSLLCGQGAFLGLRNRFFLCSQESERFWGWR